jgi:3-deoxy-D-manno-octulosonate 8-phosphate phosphatase (KDO 8-P phosphatase)
MSPLDRELEEALARVRLVALDVDGVLTDGRVVYDDAGEVQRFDVQDGQGLVWLQRSGVQVAWISGRGCAATRRRAEELGVAELHLSSGPKDEVLASVQKRVGAGVEETLAMGDDLPDLLLARRAAVFCAPANARPEVRGRARLVTERSGGRGAVREVAEHVLRARGDLEAVLAGYGA